MTIKNYTHLPLAIAFLLSVAVATDAIGGTQKRVVWNQLSSKAGELPLPPGGSQQTACVVGDVDGNGTVDFFIADRTVEPSLFLYRLVGDNWVRSVVDQEQLEIEAGGSMADVDGDGDLDLVLGQDWRGGDVWWWENPLPAKNVNTKWTRRLVKTGGKQGHDQGFGDFDGDGEIEFVTWVNQSGRVEIYEIPDDPTQTPWERVYTVNMTGEGIHIDDVDLDGKVDILAGTSWIRHDVGRVYKLSAVDSSYPIESSRIVSGQFIPGGRPEVLIGAGDANGPLNFYQYIGSNWVKTTLIDEIIHGHTLEVGDIDLDGNLDFFTAEMGDPGAGSDATAWIAWGNGAGEFEFEVLTEGLANHESKLADVDGDGDLDIVSKPFRFGGPRIDVYINEGLVQRRTIDDWKRHSIDSSIPWQALDVTAGDIDGDTRLDIIAGGWWYKNPGSIGGNWTRNLIGGNLKNVAVAHDFDDDGDLDLFGTNGKPPGGVMGWASNDGSGNFSYYSNIDEGENGTIFQGAVVADFDEDGRDNVVIQWNGGEGGGSNVDSFAVPNKPVSQQWNKSVLSPKSAGEEMSVSDIDGDGDLDIFQGLSWLRNEGSGNWTYFSIGTVPASYGNPDRNRLVDIDGDGDKDAVVGLSDFTADDVPLLWLEHPEDPTDQWPMHTVAEGVWGGYSMDSKDIDCDGDYDIVLGEHRGQTRTIIFENIAGGSSWREHIVDPGGAGIDHHDGTKLFDLDEDGDLDIVSIGWDNDKLWIFENTSKLAGDTEAPTVPQNLSAKPAVGPSILVKWSPSSDDLKVESYDVYRDGNIIGSTPVNEFIDASVAGASTYTYRVRAKDGSGNVSEQSSSKSATSNGIGENWWNATWIYRTLIAVNASDSRRTNSVVDTEVDFTELLAAQNISIAIDIAALRVVEVSENGSVLDAQVPWQFDKAPNFNSSTAAKGRLIFSVAGDTDESETRFFFVYFSRDASNAPVAAVDPVLSVDVNATDEGQSSFKVTNLNSESFFHKQGAGFSSWNDIEGNDWLGYKPSGGTSGNFRGIPNMVYPEGHFHPGATSATSTLESVGPLKATIRSRTQDNEWESLWEIYGSHAQMTVLKAPKSFWFLYEGTPGGSLDLQSDFVVRSNGTKTLASQRWEADIVGDEWAYVADPAVNRAFFVAQHEEDTNIDSYRQLDNAMTVLGFGRNIGLDSYLEDVPAKFTVGLIDEIEYLNARRAIESAYKPLALFKGGLSLLGDFDAPSTPANLRADTISSSTASLIWNASSDNQAVAGYNIYREDVASGPVGSSSNLFFEDSGLNQNTVYQYRVAALDSSGNESAKSGVLTISTPGSGEAPTAPQNLVTNPISISKIELTWSAASDNGGIALYRVFRDGLVVGETASLTFVDTGLEPNSTYKYSVIAIDADRYVSPVSQEKATVTPSDTTAPSIPGSLAVGDATESTLRISWAESTDDHVVDGYRLYRNNIEVADLHATFFVDSNLLPSTSYAYKIRSYDLSGNASEFSGEVSATTVADSESPSVPGDFKANILSQDRIELSWSAATDNVVVTLYRVYRDEIVIGDSASTSFIDRNAQAGVVYEYSVAAFDSSQNGSERSDRITLEAIEQPDPDLWLGLDFDETFGEAVFDVSPNAFDGVFDGNVSRVEGGVAGKALEFQGSGGSVDLGKIDIPGSAASIAAWIKPDDFGVSDARIISKASGVAANDHYWMLSTFDSNGTKLRMRLKTEGNSTTTLIGDRLLEANTWTHVAATYDGANIRLYINGVLDVSIAQSGAIAQNSSVPVAIGDQPEGGRNFDGLIDDVRIYRRALGPPELAAVMASTSKTVGSRFVKIPDTPENFQALPLSGTEISLSWSASGGSGEISRYVIVRDGNLVGESSSLSFTDSGLSPDTTYQYRVRAIDDEGVTSESSDPVFSSTLPPDPNAILNGGFESGLSSWKFYTSGSGDAESTAPGFSGAKATEIDLRSAASNIQLYQDSLRLAPETDYILRFSAYSSFGRDLRISLSKHSSPYTNYGLNRNRVDVTSEWQTFEIPFKTRGFGSSVVDGRLYFWFASDARAGDVYHIDDVMLIPASSAGELDSEAPSKPANMQATVSDSNGALLDWDDSSDNLAVIGYRVHRNGQVIGNTASSSFADMGLTAGIPYTYFVTAFDQAQNESAASDTSIVEIEVDSQAPTKPQGVEATGISESQIRVSWSASSDDGTVTEYHIFRNGSLAGTSTASPYTDSGLAAESSYSYKVQAIDDQQLRSELSDEASGSTLEIADSGPNSVANGGFESGMDNWRFYTNGSGNANAAGPANRGANASVVRIITSGTNVQLYQNDISLEADSDYTLSFYAYSNSGRDLRVSLGKHSSPYTNYGLNRVRAELTQEWKKHTINFRTTGFGGSTENGRLFFWFARDARVGDIYYIDDIELSLAGSIVNTDDEAPSVPPALTATILSASEVGLDWQAADDNVGVLGYIVYRDGVVVGSTVSTSYRDTSLAPAKRYTYEVSAFDAESNESERSVAAIANTPSVASPPSVPANLEARTLSETEISLSWDASNDDGAVTGYRIHRDSEEAGASTTNSFQDSGLKPGTTYSYQVQAVDNQSNLSDLSVAAQTATQSDAQSPSTPTNLQAELIGGGAVKLSWNSSNDNVGIAFYRVSRGGAFLKDVSGIEYVDLSVAGQTNYDYNVTAFDEAGNASAVSSAVTISTGDPVEVDPALWLGMGFEESSGALAFDVSPNQNDGIKSDSVATSVSGKFGKALEFSGAGGQVDLGGLDIPGSAMTIAAWIKPDSFDIHDARVVSKASGVQENDHIWMLSTISSGSIKLRMRLKTSDNGTQTLIGGTTLSKDNWTHVAGTYDGSVMRLYVNGVLENASVPASGQIAQDPSIGAAIGNQPDGGRSFDGEIDDVRIYLKSLGAPELNQIMSEPVAPADQSDDIAPSVPTALNSVLIDGNSVRLNWNESTDANGVLGYLIYRDELNIGSSEDNAYLDENLDRSTQYSYTVTAFDQAGNESSKSGAANATTSAQQGNVIMNAEFQPDLASWGFYSSGVGNARAESPGYDGSSEAAVVTISQTSSNIQLYQNDLKLKPNTEYRLRVAAYSESGRDLRVSLNKHSSPFTNYGLNRVRLDLGMEWQEFTVDFRTVNFGSPVQNGRLFFWFANDASNGDIYHIDNVRLEER